MKTFPIQHVPISGKEMLRELNSKAILNTDHEALRAYKDRVIQMKKTISYEDRINSIETQLEDIKKLLIQVLNK